MYEISTPNPKHQASYMVYLQPKSYHTFYQKTKGKNIFILIKWYLENGYTWNLIVSSVRN